VLISQCGILLTGSRAVAVIVTAGEYCVMVVATSRWVIWRSQTHTAHNMTAATHVLVAWSVLLLNSLTVNEASVDLMSLVSSFHSCQICLILAPCVCLSHKTATNEILSNFYLHDAMSQSVCLSVCSSQSNIVSKWLFKCFVRILSLPYSLLSSECCYEILMGSLLTVALNTDGI